MIDAGIVTRADIQEHGTLVALRVGEATRRDGTMTEIQALPLADLRAMLLEHEAAAHRLTDGPARDRHVAIAKGLRSHLPLYAEHRWQVRQWRAKKTRRSVRGAPPGPIVA